MKSNVLATALTQQAKFQEKDGLLTAGDEPVTVYVSVGHTMLSVDKVASVSIADDSVTIETRSESYVFAHEDIRGIRVVRKGRTGGFST